MSAETPGHNASQTLLGRISTEMVRAQKQFFGQGPIETKSYFLDDMLMIVMRDGLTVAEKTMLRFGEHNTVRAFRQTYEDNMRDTLTSLVEGLTGYKVLTYQSQIMFDPDRVVEMFVFDGPVKVELISAAAGVQPHSEVVVGEVGGDSMEVVG
jgi:uncharacterized protein YbcI